MALQDDYLKACIPEPFRVLGQRLKPFSLGHSFVLNRLRSPFAVAVSERVPSLGDLYFAVWVCRRKYADAIKGLHDGTFVKEVKWLKFVSRFKNTEAAKVMFMNYIVQAAKTPPVWYSKEGNSKAMTMPHLLYLKFLLMGKLGYSEVQAMDIPLGEAVWTSVAYSESEGGSQFQTDSQISIREMRDKLFEEAKKAHPELKPMYGKNGRR